MSGSKSREKRRDKYSPANEQSFMIHKGQKVPLGGVSEMLRHCDARWHDYLERLIDNPDAPNPFEHYGGADLRQGLRDRGYIGKSQAQLLVASDDYVSSLEAGKPPYSDTELYGVEWIPAN